MNNSKTPVSEDKVTRVKLRNGAIVLIKEDRTVPVASLNLWVEAGSIDEKPDERGMAHLIEHMIFKGTPKRGVGEISREVEAAGGYLNAFTSFEHTCFYMVLPSSRIEKALDVEFDAYLNSSFDERELAKEKEVVFEEMRMRRDDPWSWSWELFFKTAFRKNPYHWPVIGDLDILRKVPRESLTRYYRTHYVPQNTVLSIVGDVQTGKILQWLRRHFEPMTRPSAPRRVVSADSPATRAKLHLEAGPVQQTYVTLGFQTVSIDHPDAAALEVLESILGGGASSRFHLSLLEEKRLVEEVGSDHFSGKYGGSWVIQGLTDEKRVDGFLRESMAQVRKVISSGVGGDELEKVRNKIKAAKTFEKQNVDGQAKSLGYWQLQGDYHKEDLFLKALDRVAPGDLRGVAEKYLKPSNASIVIYHPAKKKYDSRPSRWQSLLEEGFLKERPRTSTGPKSSKEIQKLTLRNGNELWVKERRNLPLISLGVFFHGGFSREPFTSRGITSLMAKSLFKGTASKNNEEFSKSIEGLAAHLDAVVEKDYWGMTLDVLSAQFKEARSLMEELLLTPGFSPTEVQKEKEMQRASIARMKDDPAEYALLQSDLLTFAGTPYGHPPLGTLKTLSALTRDKVRDWYFQHLQHSRATWIAVGDVNAGDLAEVLGRKFSSFSNVKPRVLLSPARLSHVPKTHEERLKTQQANVVLGFRAPSMGTADFYVFRVLNTILNGMGGRLFVELREKKSLAYSVYSTLDAAASAGICQIYIGCAPEKVEDAKRRLGMVLNSLAEKKVSPEELDRAKTYMVGLYQMGLQANRSQVHSYARYQMAGPGAMAVDRLPESIQKVTAEQVQAMARKCVSDPFKTWVVLTPAKGK